MGVTGKGIATPESSKSRERLTVRDPRIESLLAGMQIDKEDIAETRSFGNALLRQRDAWADVNRHGRRYLDRATATYRRNALARRDGGK